MKRGKLTGSWSFLIGLGLVAGQPGCTSELSDSFATMEGATAADDPRVEVDDSPTDAPLIEAGPGSDLPPEQTSQPSTSDSVPPLAEDGGAESETSDSDDSSSSADESSAADEPTSDTDDVDPTSVDTDEPTTPLADAAAGDPTLDPSDDPTSDPTEPTTFPTQDAGSDDPVTEPGTTEPTSDDTTDEQDAGPPPDPPAGPLEVLSVLPQQDAMNADPAAHLVLTFGAPISLGTGTLEIVDLDSDLTVETISVSDTRVSLSEDSATFDLDSILMGGTAYSVSVPAGAFQGSGGELFAGKTWSFQTAAVAVPGGATTADLSLWLDADYTPSVKLTSNAIRLWADRSGHGNNLVQTAAAKRPLFATNALAGNAVVRFDGSDDFLVGPDIDDPSAYDLFVVWQSPNVSVDDLTLLVTNGVLDTCNLQMTYGHTFAGYEHAAVSEFGAFVAAAFAAPIADTATLWNSSYAAGGALVAYTNGAQTTSKATSGALVTATERFALAANDQGDYNFEGDVAELLLFNRALNATERNLVEDYLEAKWGLTLAE